MNFIWTLLLVLPLEQLVKANDDNSPKAGIDTLPSINLSDLDEEEKTNPFLNFNPKINLDDAFKIDNFPKYEPKIDQDNSFNFDNLPRYDLTSDLDKLEKEEEALSKDFKPDYHWTTFESDSSRRVLVWIIVIAILVVITILRVCLRAQIERCRNGSRQQVLLWRISTLTIFVPRSAENEPTSDVEGSANNPRSDKDDLPPSYDDAVVNVPQTTSLLS